MADKILQAAEIMKAIQDLEAKNNNPGFLGTYLLWKEAISIYNNTDNEVDVQCDKDIFTDHGGGQLASKQLWGFARRGPTHVLVNGQSAGQLLPGKKYVIEPDGTVNMVN